MKGEVHSVNILRQLVKVLVEVNDEKELREYKVEQLRFKRRHKNKKGDTSTEELKELKELEKLERKEKKEQLSKLDE